jgi:hypothetical protein
MTEITQEVKKTYGLSLPTLIIGAITLLLLMFGHMYIISIETQEALFQIFPIAK